MKRFLSAVVVAFVSIGAYAQQTHRYVVGVRAHHDRRALVREAIDLNDATLLQRNFQDLEYLDQFAADLTEGEANALAKRSDIAYVDIDIPAHAFEVRRSRSDASPAVEGSGTQVVPYGIAMTHAVQVWPATRGESANVVILDTGIDYRLPEFQHVYAGGKNFMVTPASNDPFDDNGHGTHVAGIIAAEDNSIGVVGMAPQTRIWSGKVLDKDGSTTGFSTVYAGMNWVIAQKETLGGNWIVNLSLGTKVCGGPNTDPTKCSTEAPPSMINAFQKLADAGVLVFAASGNDSVGADPATGAPADVAPVSFPAALSSVIAVGAVDVHSTIAPFSNQGPEVAFVAPGVLVKSTWIQGKGTTGVATADDAAYDAIAMEGSAAGHLAGIGVRCSRGATSADFPASVKGNIAIIERGDLTFADKARNALAAGATGVIIYNNVPGAFIGTLSDLTFPWPVVVSLSQEDGRLLAAKSAPRVSISVEPGDYAYEDGTSMATPHVSGAAALVWSTARNASASDILQVLQKTAADLGAPGRDSVFGFGLVDALAAAKLAGPQLFLSGTGQPPPGRGFLKRGRP